jgi:hypothetical protein
MQALYIMAQHRVSMVDKPVVPSWATVHTSEGGGHFVLLDTVWTATHLPSP